MSTPSLPARPDVPGATPAPDRRPQGSTAPAPAGPRNEPAPQPSDRAADADLLVDIPQLSVEELTLELEASFLVNQVKLGAKGLDTSLYLRADFERLGQLTQQRSGESGRVRSGLRELFGGSREEARVVDSSAQEPQASDEPEAHGRDVDEHDGDGDGDGARQDGSRDRARHAVAQGIKAAGFTAAGVAGGALLEAQMKPSHRLPLPRRRNRVEAVAHELGKRMPRPWGS